MIKSHSLRKFYDFVIVQSANVFGYGALAHFSAIRVHLRYEKCRTFSNILNKVIHPKYYKRLKKGAHQSHLNRQKMGWFLADQPVHQVKL